MLGILNEGRRKPYTLLPTESAKQDSNAVVSQMHHYFTEIEPRVGAAAVIGLHMDSCVGQEKSNVVLGYFKLHVIHGHHERIDLKHMTVARIKFSPDRVFGSIRDNMDRVESLSVLNFGDNIIDDTCVNSNEVLFDY